MTTLREARDVIHGLEQQRLEFLTRKARGELVRRFQAESLAATLVRDARDRAELLPHRHAAILANKCTSCCARWPGRVSMRQRCWTSCLRPVGRRADPGRRDDGADGGARSFAQRPECDWPPRQRLPRCGALCTNSSTIRTRTRQKQQHRRLSGEDRRHCMPKAVPPQLLAESTTRRLRTKVAPRKRAASNETRERLALREQVRAAMAHQQLSLAGLAAAIGREFSTERDDQALSALGPDCCPAARLLTGPAVAKAEGDRRARPVSGCQGGRKRQSGGAARTGHAEDGPASAACDRTDNAYPGRAAWARGRRAGRGNLRWPRKIGQVSKLGSPFEKDGPDDGQTEAVCGGVQGESWLCP
jgi:hypothetical protein